MARTETVEPSACKECERADRRSVGRYRFGASYLHYWYLIPTVTDSTTSPPSNFRGHGANHIFTLSVEASL